MDRVVFATFETQTGADALVAKLMTRHQGMGPFSVQLHTRRLDPLNLPDAGTVLGRNTVIYIGGGLLLGLVAGIAAAIFLPVLPGLGGWTFPVAGAFAGLIVGLLCAAMAGSREPKQAIAEAAKSLADGRILVTVLVHGSHERAHVTDLLAEESMDVGSC